jgi:sec-independent protein translocase protein TatA
MGIGSVGFTEILVIAVIVLIFFGPQRLPEMTRALGGAMREFRRSLNEIQRELEEVDRVRKWDSATASKPSADPGSASPSTGRGAVQPDLGPALAGSATGSPPHTTVPVDAATPEPAATRAADPGRAPKPSPEESAVEETGEGTPPPVPPSESPEPPAPKPSDGAS